MPRTLGGRVVLVHRIWRQADPARQAGAMVKVDGTSEERLLADARRDSSDNLPFRYAVENNAR